MSQSANWPNLERTDTFRVLDAVAGPREGTFTRVVVQGTGRREEVTSGGYHVVNVWTNGNLKTDRTSNLAPAEVETVMRVTPIQLERFDGTDVIRAIVDKAAYGLNLKCIEFDTIKGQTIDNNEFCLDAKNGTLVLEKIGNELIENTEFCSFAGALIPSKITYSCAGVRKLEIAQTTTELSSAIEDVLAPPPNAQTWITCKTYRRATAVSIVQPKPGNGGRNIDVVVRGIIDADGKVRQAVLQDSERPDLGEEALSLVRQWVFTPVMCNGEPNIMEANFVSHFHGP